MAGLKTHFIVASVPAGSFGARTDGRVTSTTCCECPESEMRVMAAAGLRHTGTGATVEPVNKAVGE